MADVRTTETRTRILDAAERLFAQHGYAATSLRAVTTEAGVNLAAVNYHFGSKESLLRETVHRVVGPVNAERLRRLDALEAGGATPSLETVLDAFVAPDLALLDATGEQARLHARLLGRILGDPGPEVQRMVAAEIGAVIERYFRALVAALPHLDPAEVWWRFRSTIGVLTFHEANPLPEPPFVPAPAAPADTRARLLAFLTAAMRAASPATHE